MEKDIIDGQIGEIGAYDLEFKGGKLVGKVNAAHPVGINASMEVSLDAKLVFAAIKKAIPGNVDDVLIGVAEAAILGQ